MTYDCHLHEGSDRRDVGEGARQVFDLDASLSRLGGSREIFDMLVALYLDDSARLLRELREAAATDDVEHFIRAAHTLKGLAANFDAVDATAAALTVETLAQQGEMNSALERLPELDREFSRLRQALVAFGEENG